MVKTLPAVQETLVWSLGQEDPLEKGVATHSSILAWRIPWTEEPGRLQSMGSQRVGHYWATNWKVSRLALPLQSGLLCLYLSSTLGCLIGFALNKGFQSPLSQREKSWCSTILSFIDKALRPRAAVTKIIQKGRTDPFLFKVLIAEFLQENYSGDKDDHHGK